MPTPRPSSHSSRRPVSSRHRAVGAVAHVPLVALVAVLRRAALVRLVPLVALVGPAEPAAAWRAPVPGTVTRPFDLGPDPFEAGRHRGIDLAARPGTKVRAPCAGPVAFAGAAGSSGRVVTLRCGAWRVSHMPLASIAVRTGEAVGAGALLGTVGALADHAGLHLGVRRAGTRFGYADPLRFLATDPAPPVPPLGRAPRPARPPSRPRPPAPRPHPVAARAPSVSPRPRAVPGPSVAPPGRGRTAPASSRTAPAAPGSSPATVGSNPPGGGPVAPWPVWLGLALVLAGAGVRLRSGPRRYRSPARAAGTVAP